jgi:threonine/homoserine/homoserine lactone efflux protein
MDFTDSLFFSGVIIGLGVSAPIGPIAMFIMRQTLTFGLLSGLAAGLSTMISKGFYAWVATFLSSFIESWLHTYSRWFYCISGIFLMYIGVKIILSHIKYNKSDKKDLESSLLSSFLHTLVLTFISPMTALLFVSLFKATGVLGRIEAAHDTAAVITGVMVGTMAWWIIFATLVSTVQKKYDLKIFKYINLISGSVIIIFSLIAIGKSIFGTA